MTVPAPVDPDARVTPSTDPYPPARDAGGFVETRRANPPPQTVRVKSGGFNGAALIIILIGGFAVYVAIKGTWKNVISAFSPLSQSQIEQQSPGSTHPIQMCPPGMQAVPTSIGHQCVPTSSLSSDHG